MTKVFKFGFHYKRRRCEMKLQLLVLGAIIAVGGYALKYFEVIKNQYLFLGIIGLGVLIFIAGLLMKK